MKVSPMEISHTHTHTHRFIVGYEISMGLTFMYDLYLVIARPPDCGHIFVSLTQPATLQPMHTLYSQECQPCTSHLSLPSVQSQDSSVFVLMFLVHCTIKYFVPAWTAIVFIHPNKLIERGGGGYLPIEEGSDSLNWAQRKVCCVGGMHCP